MAFPQNEEETIALFKLAQYQLGWRIIDLQTRFPDAVIENGSGQRLVAEFEYLSKNFRDHQHDPDGCDLIVCWKDNWENPPVPVWAIGQYTKEERSIIRRLLSGKIPKFELVAMQQENEKLNTELVVLREQKEKADRNLKRSNSKLDNHKNQLRNVKQELTLAKAVIEDFNGQANEKRSLIVSWVVVHLIYGLALLIGKIFPL